MQLPSTDRIERHIGRQHIPSFLVCTKDFSGLERCLEVNNFLLRLSKAVGVSSLSDLLAKVKDMAKPSDPNRAYPIQPMQMELVKEFHEFLGDPMPSADIDLGSPNCTAALAYWVNVVSVIRSLPQHVVYPFLGISWCRGPPSDRPAPSPQTAREGPSTPSSVVVPSSKEETVVGPSVRPRTYAATVASSRPQTESTTTPPIDKPKPVATIVCRDIRLYNPDGYLKENPCFDDTPTNIEYATDCHSHLELVSKRMKTNKLDKLIGSPPASKKFKTIVTCFCFPESDPESSRKTIQIDPRIKVCLGLHPKAARYAIDFPQFIQSIKNMTRTYPKVVGIGEVGFDFTVKTPSVEEQTKVLSDFARLAKETGLPLVLHCRDAKSSTPMADKMCIDVLGKYISPQHRLYKHCLTNYRDARLAESVPGYLLWSQWYSFNESF